ncbi:MAG TPA: helix-turn-helix transcriptional regulator [Flavisolibacter sp.]|jgi:DNA-binding XRE family transcriptional regulator
MRRIRKIPRIIKVSEVKGLTVTVVFNNGEKRVINFQEVFDSFNINRRSPEYKLLMPSEFSKLKLRNYTLSWDNVGQYVKINNTKTKVPYEIGPDVLYKLSKPAPPENGLSIGLMLKEAREKAGITQEALAQRSGTTRNYISRIENDQSGIELSTLQKIVETGLGQTLQIGIKPTPKQTPTRKITKSK